MNRRLVSDYFAGRRRAYWGQLGGFYPPYSLSAWPARAGREISGPFANPAAALLLIPGIIFVWQVMKRAK